MWFLSRVVHLVSGWGLATKAAIYFWFLTPICHASFRLGGELPNPPPPPAPQTKKIKLHGASVKVTPGHPRYWTCEGKKQWTYSKKRQIFWLNFVKNWQKIDLNFKATIKRWKLAESWKLKADYFVETECQKLKVRRNWKAGDQKRKFYVFSWLDSIQNLCMSSPMV